MMRNQFMKSLAVVMVLGITAIASTQSAHAGRGTRNFVLGTVAGIAGLTVLNSLAHGRRYDRGYRNNNYYNSGYRYPRRHYRRHNYYNGDAYRYRRNDYRRNDYRPRYRRNAPRHAYRGRPAAWSPAWYRYCASKYRSFRRSDGTFQPYQGGRRLCR